MLKKVNLRGGEPEKIADIEDYYEACWGPAGDLVFVRSVKSGLYRLPPGSNEPVQITRPDPDPGDAHLWPQILPGGKKVLFTAMDFVWAKWKRIETVSTESHERSVVLDNAVFARYVPTGHLIFARETSMYAARFDPGVVEKVGQAELMPRNILVTNISAASFDFSRTGALVYLSGAAIQSKKQLVWISRNGQIDPLPLKPDSYMEPRLSQDGSWLAVLLWPETPSANLFYTDLANPILQRRTPPIIGLSSFGWKEDGKSLLFGSQIANEGKITEAPLQKGNERPLFSKNTLSLNFSSISPRNDALLVCDYDGERRRLLVVPLEPASKERTLINQRYQSKDGSFSPDGSAIAYSSDETGSWEVYTVPYPDLIGPKRISSRGGSQPLWSRDEKHIYYISADRKALMVVDMVPGAVPAPAREHLRLPPNIYVQQFTIGYDVARDGRFLMMVSAEDVPPERIVVETDFFAELKRLIPTGK